MKKFFAAFTAALLVAMSFSACSGTGTSGTDSGATESSSGEGLSGSINISGSSALQPLVQEAADNFKKTNKGVSITVNAGGSGTGLQNVADGTVDIGNSDVFASEKLPDDKASELVDHIVCVVGVAVIANPDIGVTNITKEQLKGIFTGKITNWKDIGGKDQKIVLINRPKSSGTRSLFKKYGLDGEEEKTGEALTEDNSGTLKQNVAQTPGSVAYLALSYLTDDKVMSLSIDSVKPNYDNIYSGKYSIWGYEHMYTKGTPSGPAKSFLEYFSSTEAEKTITDMGYGLSSKMTVKRDAPEK
ncbi:MAG TPA: phosphate-binding protein [Ruminococcaceae bacterium]|jgi:phosphate transport system substrate-binding protein|nr:phosphate-binding protein [Oscillospiraceae bacterium]